MKMSDKHFALLRQAVERLEDRHPEGTLSKYFDEVRASASRPGSKIKSAERYFVWDIYWRAKKLSPELRGLSYQEWDYKDAHIETALNKILEKYLKRSNPRKKGPRLAYELLSNGFVLRHDPVLRWDGLYDPFGYKREGSGPHKINFPQYIKAQQARQRERSKNPLTKSEAAASLLEARNNPAEKRVQIGRQVLAVKTTRGTLNPRSKASLWGLPDGSIFVQGFFTNIPAGPVLQIDYLDEAKAKREGLSPASRPWRHDFSSERCSLARTRGGLLIQAKKKPLWGYR
jgi:hypothetical protein